MLNVALMMYKSGPFTHISIDTNRVTSSKVENPRVRTIIGFRRCRFKSHVRWRMVSKGHIWYFMIINCHFDSLFNFSFSFLFSLSSILFPTCRWITIVQWIDANAHWYFIWVKKDTSQNTAPFTHSHVISLSTNGDLFSHVHDFVEV